MELVMVIYIEYHFDQPVQLTSNQTKSINKRMVIKRHYFHQYHHQISMVAANMSFTLQPVNMPPITVTMPKFNCSTASEYYYNDSWDEQMTTTITTNVGTQPNTSADPSQFSKYECDQKYIFKVLLKIVDERKTSLEKYSVRLNDVYITDIAQSKTVRFSIHKRHTINSLNKHYSDSSIRIDAHISSYITSYQIQQ